MDKIALEQRISLINIEIQKLQGHLQEANHWLMEILKKEQERLQAQENKALEDAAKLENIDGEVIEQTEEQAA